jgi:PKD repeat protein
MKGAAGLMSLILIIGCAADALAQCPSPQFVLPGTACRDQNITIDNQSATGTFQWDYCSGDLNNTPTASLAYTLAGINGLPNFEYVRDGDHWYAFVTATYSNRLYRIDYGTDPSQATVGIENLGDLGGKLNGPESLRIINDDGEWIGLLHNSNNGELLKLSFGNSLGNVISTTSLFTGIGGVTTGLAVAHDGANGWVCVLSTPANNFQIIRLGEDIVSPTPADILVTTNVPNPNNLFDLDIIRMCDEWYGFSTNLGNGAIHRLSFGSSLFQQPVIDQVADLAVVNTGRVRAIKDGDQYFLAVATPAGDFYKVSLGNDLANLSVALDNEGTFASLLQNSIGVGVAFHNSTWTISVIDSSTGKVTSVKYPNNCTAIELSNDGNSPVIRYTQQGSYQVSLTMTDASGASGTVTESIVVTPAQSPDIAISTQNVCVGHDVIFAPQSVAGGIDTYDWAFGDATANSNAASPVHVYAAAGVFTTSLDVQAPNGCTNRAQKEITLYDAPVAAFTVPSGLICTNNVHAFTTNTQDTYDGLLQYAWSVDGTPVATSRNLAHTFTTTGNKGVMLQVSIPGCSDDVTETISNVQSGPSVDFTSDGQCEDQVFRFTNLSSGDIAGYLWDFDDGGTSDALDPEHTFSNAGSYTVILNTSGTNGCVSTISHEVTPWSQPVPAFSLDLPPFSCAGTPSQFHDATPPLSDSNVNQWNWSFGDNGTGTGEDPVHNYASAGTFSVRLSVTTDKGCTEFIDQEVSIAPSPVVAFTSDPTCLNQSTRFTSTSTGDIKSYQWKIGNQVYAVENPVHVFGATGNSSAQLTVTGNNECVSTVTKPVIVPVVPTLDFGVQNACSGQAVTFTDLTSGSPDPVAQQTWTFGTETRTGSPVTFSFPNGGDYAVKLDVKNQSGCVYSLMRQVTINPSPVVGFAMSIDSGPPPLHVSFTNTSTGAASYQWNFNDGNGFRTEASQEYTYNALGDYPVTLSAIGTQGCVSIQTQFVHVIIPVNELALEEFSVVQSGSGYRGYVRVHNNGNYRIGGFSVTYDVGGGILVKENVITTLNPGQTSMVLLSNEFTSPASAGYICAELQSDDNLFDNKACAAFNGSVVLTPYPNPTDIYLNVETVHREAGTVRVMLFNSSGGNDYDKTFDVNTGLSRLTLDVQNLSPGIYVMVVTAGGITTSQKLVITR